MILQKIADIFPKQFQFTSNEVIQSGGRVSSDAWRHVAMAPTCAMNWMILTKMARGIFRGTMVREFLGNNVSVILRSLLE